MKNPPIVDKEKPGLVRKLSAWLPLIVWAAVLFGLSSIPGQEIPTFDVSFSDKIAHCAVYGVWGILSFRALRLTTRLRLGYAILLTALMALAYGVSDEIHQMFVPQRSPDPLDVMADVFGGTLGALAGSLWPGWARRAPR
jgi:VanZ family protein